jgi:hypothetical protein
MTRTAVTIPIRVRVDAAAVKSHRDVVDSALRAAAGRALTKAAKQFRVPQGQAWVTSIDFNWSGSALADVAGDPQKWLEWRIRAAIRELARAHGIADHAPMAIDYAWTSDRLRAPDAETRGLAFLEIVEQVYAGDSAAFWLALTAIQPDDSPPTAAALAALAVLLKRDPATFQRLFEWATTVARSRIVKRSDRDVFVDEDIRRQYGPVLGGAIRVAQALPAIGYVKERGRVAPGFERLIGLIDVHRQLKGTLAKYLRDARQPTDTKQLDAIIAQSGGAQAFGGVLAALADDERVKHLITSLQPDVVESIRWLSWTLESLRQVDGDLTLYADAFGEAADQQEEVQVLREVRTLLLRLIVEYPLPRATITRDLQRQGADAVAGWRLTAADRRVARLRGSVADLRDLLEKLHVVNPYFEAILGDEPWWDARVPFGHRLQQTRLALDELAVDVDVAAERRLELLGLLEQEQRVAVVSLRLALLSVWQGTLELEKYTHAPWEYGDDEEKDRWRTDRRRIRDELAAAFDHPNLDTFQQQYDAWERELKRLESELRHAAKREFYVSLAINVGLLLLPVKILPRGVGGVRAVAIGAVEFTALSTLLRSVALDKPVDPSAALNELVDTFIFFGAFEILNALVKAGALRYLRGRPVAQFALILGTPTVVATGLPIVLAHIAQSDDEDGGWTEQDSALVVTGLVMAAIGGALTGPQFLSELRIRAGVELHADFVALREASIKYGRDELRPVFGRGPSSRRAWERLRNRGVDLLRRLQTTLERMEKLPENTRIALGLNRVLMGHPPSEIGMLADHLASMEYLEPKTLPGSTSLIAAAGPGTLVQRGANVFEYDPTRITAAQLTRRLTGRLRAAGYSARNLGGVIALTAGPSRTEFRLLPAATPAPPRMASAERAAGEALVLGAAAPANTAVRELLAGAAGDALAVAAQLEPELVRRAILSEPVEETAALARLERALADIGMAKDWIDRVRKGAGAAASARRAAVAAGPLQDLLAAAGGGPRVREALTSADGQALVEAAKLAPVETRAAVGANVLVEDAAKAVAIETWQAQGLAADRVTAAAHALDALKLAKANVPLSGVEAIVAAGGGSSARAYLEELAAKEPSAHALVLAAFDREPTLFRRALAAVEQRTLVDATSELVRRLQTSGMSADAVTAVGDAIFALNKGRRASATEYEELNIRAERVRGLLDVVALRRDALPVIQRFSQARQQRAQRWLQTLVPGTYAEISELVREVDASPELQAVAARGGGDTMLRQLWTMYRSGRARTSALRFSRYVEVLTRTHYQGLHGEYAFAFWAGDSYIVIKAPDAGVTLRGTDIVLIPRGGGPPIWVDQKALSSRTVDSVTALTRNLPKNVRDDLVFMESLITSGREFPPELLQALPLQREADARIATITQGMTKDQVESPAVQQQITAELQKLGIKRAIGTFGGEAKEMSLQLRPFFDIWPADE